MAISAFFTWMPGATPYLCGHATIGAVASLIETGALEAVDGQQDIIVDSPSGPICAHTRIQNGRVESVAIDMVPSFVFDTGCSVDCTGFWRGSRRSCLCGRLFQHGIGTRHWY